MELFWVQGLYVKKEIVKRVRRTGWVTPKDCESFAKTFWAETPEQAIQHATHELEGGAWIENPYVSLAPEELRMRAVGAPELPGLLEPRKKKK